MNDNPYAPPPNVDPHRKRLPISESLLSYLLMAGFLFAVVMGAVLGKQFLSDWYRTNKVFDPDGNLGPIVGSLIAIVAYFAFVLAIAIWRRAVSRG